MRVVIIPAGEGGVAWYRCIQPYSYLRDKLGKEVFIYDKKKHDLTRLYHEIDLCDIIIYQMACGELLNNSIRKLKAKFGNKKKVVAEYDDNIFRVSPWNQKYNVFGTSEVEITYSNPKVIETIKNVIENEPWVKSRQNKDGSWTFTMWTDGHNDLNIKNNIDRLNAAKETIRIADLVTTTTPELAGELREFRPKGKIAVLPNLVDFSRFLPMKKTNDGKIRIGWQGGSAHFHDLCLVGPELIEFAKRHPEVEYVFQGIAYTAIFEEIKDRVKWLPWHSDILTYPLAVRELGIDIAICPLTDDAFNKAKSPLKWEEMSAMKVPCVCSPTVYGKFVEHGKDGYIAREGEWCQCLEELMSEEKRNLVSETAHKRVKARYGIENATMFWSALQDLVFGTESFITNKREVIKYSPIVVPELNEMELALN